MNRRDILKGLGFGAAAGAFGLFRKSDGAAAEAYSKAVAGLPPLKITKVKAITT